MAATTDMIATDNALTGAVLESLVTRGDISGLPSQAKAKYYAQLCERVGLDPATTPFQPLKLNGKEILYATKGAAEQLRKLHKISITITARDRIEDVYYVTARATMADGRTDESQGAVTVAGLKGDPLANAVMKAETKAKRRVTLSIVGLGMLDESELDTIQPDKFANLRPEQSASVVSMPKTDRPKSKPSEALPPLPEHVTDLPPTFLLACKQLEHLSGVTLAQMSDEDLELVIETIGRAYEARQAKGNTSEHGLKWMRAIVADATRTLDERRNGASFDPQTGEVRS